MFFRAGIRCPAEGGQLGCQTAGSEAGRGAAGQPYHYSPAFPEALRTEAEAAMA